MCELPIYSHFIGANERGEDDSLPFCVSIRQVKKGRLRTLIVVKVVVVASRAAGGTVPQTAADLLEFATTSQPQRILPKRENIQ